METNTFLKHGQWEKIKEILKSKKTVYSRQLSIKNGCWIYDTK